MAPINQSKYTSSSKKPSPPAVDDDDRWTDLVSDKEGKDSPAQTETSTSPAPVPKFPPQMTSTPLSPASYFPPDSLGRATPTQQMTLEAQLMHLAEIELGLINAVDIIEKHVLNTRDRNLVHEPYELNFPTTYPTLNPTRITASPANRSSVYNTERHNSAGALRDMAYLIGLGRAVKILKEAVADENRKDATYNVKIVPGPMPMPPHPPFPPTPMMYPGLPPSPLASQSSQLLQEKEFRNIAKDIVKDSVREYKDTVVGPSMEEVQQEMIKLCRDVCRDALNRKD